MKLSEIKKLDKKWGEIVRSRGRCEVCGQAGRLNAHHIIGRRNHALRWDIKNGVCLCSGCHTFRTQSAHQDPEWFHDWLVEHRPQDIEYLRQKRKEVIKQTYEEVNQNLQMPQMQKGLD